MGNSESSPDPAEKEALDLVKCTNCAQMIPIDAIAEHSTNCAVVWIPRERKRSHSKRKRRRRAHTRDSGTTSADLPSGSPPSQGSDSASETRAVSFAGPALVPPAQRALILDTLESVHTTDPVTPALLSPHLPEPVLAAVAAACASTHPLTLTALTDAICVALADAHTTQHALSQAVVGLVEALMASAPAPTSFAACVTPRVARITRDGALLPAPVRRLLTLTGVPREELDAAVAETIAAGPGALVEAMLDLAVYETPERVLARLEEATQPADADAGRGAEAEASRAVGGALKERVEMMLAAVSARAGDNGVLTQADARLLCAACGGGMDAQPAQSTVSDLRDAFETLLIYDPEACAEALEKIMQAIAPQQADNARPRAADLSSSSFDSL